MGSTYQQLVLCGELRGNIAKRLSILNPGGRTANAIMDCIGCCEVMCSLKFRSPHDSEKVPGQYK